jgi:hypothetical protein
VTFLARKINRAKWDPVEGFAAGEIAANAVGADAHGHLFDLFHSG